MNKYLIDDKTMIVFPKLAKAIGLNESLMLQQIHYWLLKKKNEADGYYWVYNSYQDWVENDFIFWSPSTVKRTLKSLEEQGYIISTNGRFNSRKGDQTKWYRIDYPKLTELFSTFDFFDGRVKPTGQVDQLVDEPTGQSDIPTGQVDHTQQVKLTKPLPEITSKINNKNNKPKTKVSELVFDKDSDEYKLTHFYIDRMKKMTDGIYEPTANLNKWYNEMRLMIDSTLKNVSENRVERCKKVQDIILYATNDSFWLGNILSIPKLRKQANTLQIRMQTSKGFNNNNNTNQAQPTNQYKPVKKENLFRDC